MKHIFAISAFEHNVITRQFVNTVLCEILKSNSGCHTV
jgi:hypothetical protein